MTDKKKDYLGCIPKEEVPKFLENFKKGLAEGKKSNEKKEISFEIKDEGCKGEPNGISFELFSFDKEKYADLVDDSAEHMKGALILYSARIKVKDEAQVEMLKGLFQMFQPMITSIPFVESKKDVMKIEFRSKGTNVNVDVVMTDGKFLKPIVELGLNPSEFRNLRAFAKTALEPNDLFALKDKAKEFFSKLLQSYLSLKGNATNFKFLLTALLKALNEVKLSDPKKQKKLTKVARLLVLLNGFVSAKSEIQYSGAEICNAAFEDVKDALGVNPEEALESVRKVISELGSSLIKPALEGMGLLDTFKNVDIEEIVLFYALPSAKTGIAQSIKLPGIIKVLAEHCLN